MNRHLRDLLDSNIKKMCADAKNASQMKHPGLTGKLRECFLNDLIRPLLNNKYSTGPGKITDFDGKHSKEMDLCIYSTSLLPPFFFSPHESSAVYPIESVLACFEVKSRLTTDELRDAYSKFLFMDQELTSTPGIHDNLHRPSAHYFSKPEYSVFAFGLNRKGYTANTILDLYKKVDPKWDTDPLITSICIPGKGCLIHTVKGWLHMPYDQTSKLNEEVIFYLCAIVQGLPSKENSRGTPRIGYYLTNPSLTDRFEAGVPVQNPWGPYQWVIHNQVMASDADRNPST